MSRTPRIIGGRWEIVGPLAEGGMAAIYVARHRQTGRQAALKVIEGDRPEALARFKLEASVAAEVNHPGIVEVFDADFDPKTSTCFIAMELLRGRTLRAVLDDEQSRPQQVVDLLTLALEPLAAAHAKGFIHRDLKPENIFVVESGTSTGAPRVKLLDFGIAAQEGTSRHTRTGTAMGTPHYMSPEQATDARSAGPTSDVWAIGVMLYEAIRGDVPFNGENAHGIIVKACTREHEPLESVVDGLDVGLARLIDRCLAKAPEVRPLDAGILLCELRALLRPNSLPAARLQRRMSAPAVAEANASGIQPRSQAPQLAAGAPPGAALPIAAGLLILCAAAALALVGAVAPENSLLVALVASAISVNGVLRLRARRRATPALSASMPQATVVERRDEPLVIEHPARGPDSARVVIELYADLSSAVTRRICQRVMAMRSEFADDIRVIVKALPDPNRDESFASAEVLRDVFERCGSEAYWHVFDRLVSSTRKINTDLLLELAVAAGAPLHELRRALRSRLRRRVVAACREEAVERGATQSPSLFVNGQMLLDDLSDDRLRWAYYDALNESRRHDEVELAEMRTEMVQVGPERMRLRGVLIRYQGARNAPRALRRTREQAEERAHKLLSRARLPGADFGDLALRFGDGLIELGEVELCELSEPMQDSVARLAVGQVGKPVECDEGFRVMQRVG